MFRRPHKVTLSLILYYKPPPCDKNRRDAQNAASHLTKAIAFNGNLHTEKEVSSSKGTISFVNGLIVSS